MNQAFKLHVPQKDDYTKQVIKDVLSGKVAHCRIVRKACNTRHRYYLQIVIKAPSPRPVISCKGRVALDEGPSQTAVVAIDEEGNKHCHLFSLRKQIADIIRKMKPIQRAMNRSLKLNNPSNYTRDGALKGVRVKKGYKKWKRSKNYERLRTQYSSLCRRLAASVETFNNTLANQIVSYGCHVRTESLSIVAWQKMFGKSILYNAPGKLRYTINRKAEKAGGEFVELDTWNLKMSQYDHLTDDYHKKPLSLREHNLGQNTEQEVRLFVQRDIYSAFLALNVEFVMVDGKLVQQHNQSKLIKEFKSWEPFLRANGFVKEVPAI